MTSFDDEEEKISNPFNESFGEENILPTLTRGEIIIEDEKLLFEEEKTHTVNEIIPQEDEINLQDNLIVVCRLMPNGFPI